VLGFVPWESLPWFQEQGTSYKIPYSEDLKAGVIPAGRYLRRYL